MKRLRELVDRLRQEAAKGSVSQEENQTLHFAIENTMGAALGANHPAIHRVAYASTHNTIMNVGETQWEQWWAEDLQFKAKLLEEYVVQMEKDLVDIVPPGPVAKPETSLQQIDRLLLRFHRVARRLRSRHGQRKTLEVDDEYDVQDLLHALFTIFFDDIRPEEWTPSYAGKSARMDFLLKGEQVVVETKMTRAGLGEKEIGDELIVDIARYQGHPDCKTLVCFVYDPLGRIGNPDGLERDLSRVEGTLTVKIIVAPKL